MKRVAWITDNIYLKHNTGGNHPESVERLISINLKIKTIIDKLIEIKPRFATKDDIEMVHNKSLIQTVKEKSKNEIPIDLDTVLSKESYKSALKAVGAGLEAIDGIKESRFDRAFCAVRPPGHHATPTQSMGFCLFNYTLDKITPSFHTLHLL